MLGYLLAPLLLYCSPVALAFPDSLDASERQGERLVLYLGDLNRDLRQDTIYGGYAHGIDLVPARISWGTSSPTIARSTAIKLPNWRRWKLSFAIEDMNADTTTDLLLFIHGKVTVAGSERDSVRSIVVFGQQGLDTLHQINLNSVAARFQSSPFVAMDLRRGDHLRNRSIRDMSGLPSYELIRPLTSPRDSTGRPAPGTDVLDLVTLYPNPASADAFVEPVQLGPGRYRIDLLSVNGTRYASREVELARISTLLTRIDVSTVPAGYYIVRVLEGDRVLGDYPLVVVH